MTRTSKGTHLVEVTAIDESAADLEFLDGFCANPRCDERLQHSTGPGRRAKYHDPACKRETERMVRRLRGRLQHFQSQVDMVNRQLAAYTEVDEAPVGEPGPSDEQSVGARIAFARATALVETMDGDGSSERWARELKRLVQALDPVLG
ncbi:hypothetical protein BJF86_15920 [Serinicoccus sp. CNJ-927]|uniref:hypothetical protein n=1 Tax=Serinicoccus sp. CNJ-927 TaxID=1904970 RepID=UPI000968E1BD|nr:hypothetical protein [Serinicoccus sp. CNJ-927]OLT41296.1 hypothetical protein BJF86_15920 [Serinicoccus sp. CNJ-927]